MTESQLKSRIESLAPQTHAVLTDLTGTQDHWQALVISPAFEGKTLLERQQMVFALLKSEVSSNEVHALTLRTYTPEQYQNLKK